jgi:hypothetical protein
MEVVRHGRGKPPEWEVGEAGAHVPLKTARRRFNPVTSHSLPYSSTVEQPAVNGKVVGSSPTGAAIHCRVDDLESRYDSESWRCWFDSSLGIQSKSTLLLASTLASRSRSTSSIGKYANRQSDLTLNQVVEGSIPSFPVGGHERDSFGQEAWNRASYWNA